MTGGTAEWEIPRDTHTCSPMCACVHTQTGWGCYGAYLDVLSMPHAHAS